MRESTAPWAVVREEGEGHEPKHRDLHVAEKVDTVVDSELRHRVTLLAASAHTEGQNRPRSLAPTDRSTVRWREEIPPAPTWGRPRGGSEVGGLFFSFPATSSGAQNRLVSKGPPPCSLAGCARRISTPMCERDLIPGTETGRHAHARLPTSRVACQLTIARFASEARGDR
jgi:hypothetical protein